MRDQPVTPPIPKSPEHKSLRPPRHHPLPPLTVSASRLIAPDTVLPITTATVNNDKRKSPEPCTPENTTTMYSARLSRLQKMRVLRDLVVCQRQMADFKVVGPRPKLNLLKASVPRKTHPSSRQESTSNKLHAHKSQTLTSTYSSANDHRPSISSDLGLQQMVDKYSGPVQEYCTQPSIFGHSIQHTSLHDRRLALENLASSARTGRETCLKLAGSILHGGKSDLFIIGTLPTSLLQSSDPVAIRGCCKSVVYQQQKKAQVDIIPSTSRILQELFDGQDIRGSDRNLSASSNQPILLPVPSTSKPTDDSWNLWTPNGTRNSHDLQFARASDLVQTIPSVSDIKYPGASTVPSILKGTQTVWNTALVKEVELVGPTG